MNCCTSILNRGLGVLAQQQARVVLTAGVGLFMAAHVLRCHEHAYSIIYAYKTPSKQPLSSTVERLFTPCARMAALGYILDLLRCLGQTLAKRFVQNGSDYFASRSIIFSVSFSSYLAVHHYFSNEKIKGTRGKVEDINTNTKKTYQVLPFLITASVIASQALNGKNVLIRITSLASSILFGIAAGSLLGYTYPCKDDAFFSFDKFEEHTQTQMLKGNKNNDDINNNKNNNSTINSNKKQVKAQMEQIIIKNNHNQVIQDNNNQVIQDEHSEASGDDEE